MGAIRGHGGCKSGIIAVVQFGNESESILKVDRIDHYALGITSGVSLRLSQNVWTVAITRGDYITRGNYISRRTPHLPR